MFMRCVFLLAVLPLAMAPVALAQEDAAPPSPVARIAVCTNVVEREPVGEATSFSAEVAQLYCFTEIQGRDGETITHAWIHDGVTRARVDLPVRSNRWRTWSTKQIRAEWTGSWQVKVLDSEGLVLSSVDFVVE